MGYLKYLYENDSIKLVIEEDVVGFYLTVYEKNKPNTSVADYLQDSLDAAFLDAEEKFGVSKEQWKLQP